MSDWIRKLAEGIREKDHRELVEKEHQLHVARVVGLKAPLFLADVGQKLKEYIEQLKADLGNETLASDLQLTQGSNQFYVNKSELPYVFCQISLDAPAKLINVAYNTANPRPAQGVTQANKVIHLHLKLTSEDELYLEDGEHKFNQPHMLAEHIMKLLFTV